MFIFRTNPHDYSAMWMRVVLAVIFFPHGARKLFGWFRGVGFETTMSLFEMLGVPWIFGLLVMLIEFVGAFFLLAGLLSRLVASGLAATMLGAIVLVQWSNGFFMNWNGQQAGEGIQFSLLAIGMAVAVVIQGSGAWSLDRRIQERFGVGEQEASQDMRGQHVTA